MQKKGLTSIKPYDIITSSKRKEVLKMTMVEFNEKLVAWINVRGTSKESLNDFANVHATSYEEYNAIWEILDSMFGEA
jgi:hypothetical protein